MKTLAGLLFCLVFFTLPMSASGQRDPYSSSDGTEYDSRGPIDPGIYSGYDEDEPRKPYSSDPYGDYNSGDSYDPRDPYSSDPYDNFNAGSDSRGPYSSDPNENDPWDTDPSTYDCQDFSNSAEAQAFFEAHGGPARDPYYLDKDNDGLACEPYFGDNADIFTGYQSSTDSSEANGDTYSDPPDYDPAPSSTRDNSPTEPDNDSNSMGIGGWAVIGLIGLGLVGWLAESSSKKR